MSPFAFLLQRSRRVVSVQTTPSKWRLLNKQCYGVPECMPSIGYSRRLPPVERGLTSPTRHLLRSGNRLHDFHKRLRSCGHQPRRTTIPGDGNQIPDMLPRDQRPRSMHLTMHAGAVATSVVLSAPCVPYVTGIHHSPASNHHSACERTPQPDPLSHPLPL